MWAVPEGGLLDGTVELAQAGELGEIADTASEFIFGPGTAHGEYGDERRSGGDFCKISHWISQKARSRLDEKRAV